jgi:hypothetical protein
MQLLGLYRPVQATTEFHAPRPSANNRHWKLCLPSKFEQIEQFTGDLFSFVGRGERTSGEFLQKHFSDWIQFEQNELPILFSRAYYLVFVAQISG